MVSSKAATVEEYLAELPEDRRAVVSAVMTRPAWLGEALTAPLVPGEAAA